MGSFRLTRGLATTLLTLSIVVLVSFFQWGGTGGTAGSVRGRKTPIPPQTVKTPTPGSSNQRQAGINTMPGMRPSHFYGPNPDSWWCVVPNCVASDPLSQITTEMGFAKQAGVKYLRIEFDWPLIEPARGQYNWTRADYIVQTAASDGIQLAPVLVFSPNWACASATCAPSAADFGAFVQAVVSRYKSSVHVWEMWNEPDGSGYWSDTEQHYVQDVLVPGYQAAKSADPTTMVEIGAPAIPDTGWLNNIYSLGGGNSFDIMGWHDYTVGSQVLADANTVESVLTAHGQASKPLWLGEFSVQEQGTSDSQQMALLQTVLEAQNSPIAVAFWYNLRDDSSYTCCPPHDVKDAYWGLVQRGETPKQGLAYLHSLIAAGLPPIG